MTTYATSLGAVSPGILVSDQNTGVFSGLSAPTSNQVLVSTGTDGYTYLAATNLPSPLFSTGIIQFSLYNLGGAAFPSQGISTVGDSTTNYDAAAQVFSINFAPYSTTSKFVIEFYYTAQSQSQTISVNLYGIPDQIPTPVAYGQIKNSQSGNMAAGCAGTFDVPNINFSDTFNVVLCAFTTAGSGTQTGGSPFDYILVKEFADALNPLKTATVTSTSATPVTLLTLDPTFGNPGLPSSIWLYGTVTFFDSANLISNMQKDWMVLAQYNGVTTTVQTGPTFTLTSVPTLTYTVSGTSVVIEVVGEASETFNCVATYQQINGGI